MPCQHSPACAHLRQLLPHVGDVGFCQVGADEAHAAVDVKAHAWVVVVVVMVVWCVGGHEAGRWKALQLKPHAMPGHQGPI